MTVAFLLILTAVLYGLYNTCMKASTENMHPLLSMLVLQVGAIAIGIAALVYVSKFSGIPMQFPRKESFFAIGAGVFVALAEATTLAVFARGVPASIGVPSIIGGSVVAGAILAVVLLGEKITGVQIFAMALIITGIALLGGRH